MDTVSDGEYGLKNICTDWSSGMVRVILGFLGELYSTTVFIADGSEYPRIFTAFNETEYELPIDNPVIVYGEITFPIYSYVMPPSTEYK